jgi:hypothetical protein
MKDGPNFCKKGVRTDICFSSMMTPGKKLKEVIVYEHVDGQKPPLVSPNSPPSRRNNSRKIRTVTRKMKNWKNRARRWLRFSLLMVPVKKLGEVFVLHPVLNKNLFRFLKIHLCLPRIAFGK